MSKPIRLAIITARNLKTSSGSNNTVLSLLNSLDEKIYKISIVLVDDFVPKFWQINQEELEKDSAYAPFKSIEKNSKVSECLFLSQLSLKELKDRFEIAIVAIYNYFGEDGKLLGLLEIAGIPYVSPSLKSSVVCFDKKFCKSVLKAKGVLVCKDFEVYKKGFEISKVKEKIRKSFKYPLMVKTVSCGASRGVSLVSKDSELEEAITNGFAFSEEVLVEEYIDGEEYTVGVIGHYTSPKALPVMMIKTSNIFFDYEAKYVAGKTKEICPAPIDDDLKKKLQLTAKEAYQAVKAESHARVDMIYKDGKVYVLEINSFPGLLSQSLFPQELKADGSSLTEFLDKTIEEKLKK